MAKRQGATSDNGFISKKSENQNMYKRGKKNPMWWELRVGSGPR